MSQVYLARHPKTGDIYSRYIIPDSTPTDIIQEMTERSIEIITETIRTEFGMIKSNENLSIWTTVYGTHNPHGLTQTSKIKIREKRPQAMAFQMNY